jgi:3-isopropylmalate/(R)-2-methylmalate dehydratase small subunit
LFAMSRHGPLRIDIDLGGMALLGGGERFGFTLTPREKMLLTQDVDWIAATLAQRERIAGFEAARLARQPWLAKVLEH